MEAIVLTGGLGTRLRAVTGDSIPKGLAMVRGKPILEHVLDQLNDAGVAKVHLAIGHLGDKITEHFVPGYSGLDIRYSIEDSPMGTGGAVKQAIKSVSGERVLVVNGDTLIKIPLAEMESRINSEVLAVLLLAEVPNLSSFGGVGVSGDRVTTFQEKSVSGPGLASCGIVAMTKESFLKTCSGLDKFDLESKYLSVLASEGHLSYVHSSTGFVDIGTPEAYQQENDRHT